MVTTAKGAMRPRRSAAILAPWTSGILGAIRAKRPLESPISTLGVCAAACEMVSHPSLWSHGGEAEGTVGAATYDLMP